MTQHPTSIIRGVIDYMSLESLANKPVCLPSSVLLLPVFFVLEEKRKETARKKKDPYENNKVSALAA